MGTNIRLKEEHGDLVRIEKNVYVDADEYSQLKRAFMGGHTHANAHYVDKVLDNVASQDFASSYPAVMLLEKFPMSKATLETDSLTKERFSQLISTKACLFDVIFKGIYHKLKFEHPIPSSKCWLCNGAMKDNGKIVMADEIGITVTEQDFLTYSEFYTWKSMEISNFRWYHKQYLPHEFAKAILGMYERKTTLKDVPGEEVDYMISKNMLNSCFGMAVTDIVRDDLGYDSETEKYTTVHPKLESAVDKYNENVRRFLFYPWGVWITAYARRNLFTGIEAIGDDFVYSDTDSIKYLHPKNHENYFASYNNKILAKIALSAAYHTIDTSKFSPLNKKGAMKTIGLWDYEGVYEQFKTLGAKRYIYRIGDKYSVTIAGANKKGTADYLVNVTRKPFDSFTNELHIPQEYAGRLTATYIDDEHTGIVTDYLGIPFQFTELSATHLEPSDYNLTMSDEFINYLKGVKDLGWD